MNMFKYMERKLRHLGECLGAELVMNTKNTIEKILIEDNYKCHREFLRKKGQVITKLKINFTVTII